MAKVVEAKVVAIEGESIVAAVVVPARFGVEMVFLQRRQFRSVF
jgi:hypothetical protein